jgi:lipoprotein-anchoring transpeptidase ErfK/SrfK
LRLQAAQALRKAYQAPPTQVFTSEYGSVKDAGYRIPAVPISKVKERYHRQIVSYRTREKPGTIIVDTPNRYLYFVLPGRKAVRYGIGVGKAGFAWEGEAYIAWKQAWPKWTPPKEMIQRRPDLARYGKDGMKPVCATRSVPAPSISSTRMARTHFSGCTAHRNGTLSELPPHRAASG